LSQGGGRPWRERLRAFDFVGHAWLRRAAGRVLGERQAGVLFCSAGRYGQAGGGSMAAGPGLGARRSFLLFLLFGVAVVGCLLGDSSGQATLGETLAAVFPAPAALAASLVVLGVYTLIPTAPPSLGQALPPALVVGLAVGVLTGFYGLIIPPFIRAFAVFAGLAALTYALLWLEHAFQALLFGATWATWRRDEAAQSAPSPAAQGSYFWGEPHRRQKRAEAESGRAHETQARARGRSGRKASGRGSVGRDGGATITAESSTAGFAVAGLAIAGFAVAGCGAAGCGALGTSGVSSDVRA
jgi:hypothetical protein